jgi:hypothetical protein
VALLSPLGQLAHHSLLELLLWRHGAMSWAGHRVEEEGEPSDGGDSEVVFASVPSLSITLLGGGAVRQGCHDGRWSVNGP